MSSTARAQWRPTWSAPTGWIDGEAVTATIDWLLAEYGPPEPALAELVKAAVADALANATVADEAAMGGLRALVTLAEARALLRCSDRQIRRLVATGELKSVRRVKGGSSRVLIPRESLLAYLAERQS